MELLLATLLGAVGGALAGWFLHRRRDDGAAQLVLRGVEQQLESTRAELAEERRRAQAGAERAAAAETDARNARAEKAEALDRHREDLARAGQRRMEELQLLRDSFARQSQEVLRALAPDVTRQVAAQVEPLVAAVRTSLENVDLSVRSGLQRQGDALAAVRERMEALGRTTELLAAETNDFTAVLKSAAHRGAWGEQTLRRVVEAAGLSPHCDFSEQTGAGDRRPDLIVRLPGGRCVIIDSKVPELEAAAARADQPNRAELLRDHAQKLRATIKALAARGYPEAVARELGLQAFDQVILFLPAESLLSTALEADPGLVFDAGRHGVLLATPATLLGFLGAIHLSWQQHAQAEQVAEIAAAATELYKRVADFAEHLAGARKNVNAAVESLNNALGSFERMVRPKGEELGRLGVRPSKPLPPEITPIESMRDLRRPSA